MNGINYDEIISKSKFLKQWKNDMIKTLKTIEPTWDKDKIKEKLNEMIKEELQLPEVTLDNNYTGESRQTNILSVFDWCIARKPLIAGNATFYKNQLEAINPVANMLDSFLIERKRLKKEMFKVEDKTSDLYKDLDRSQLNKKILANSYYGSSGMNKSAFYSKWSGPATTGTAQSVISTTETFFEGFLVDNYKFIDINECFHYMNSILVQDYKLEKFVKRVSHKELLDRILNMFYDDIYKKGYYDIIEKYISNLSEDDVTKIYYKNNIIEFIQLYWNCMTNYFHL